MPPREIDVQSLESDVRGMIREFAPSNCELLLVDSVKEWANKAGLAEKNPFRTAMAVVGHPGNVPIIVMLKRISEDIQGSVVGALLFRGFGSEADRLNDSATFLEHLVLHEIAHLVLDNPSESDCDAWAFEKLSGRPRISSGGAA